jgi:hypothetical protein
MAVTMKSAISLNVIPCSLIVLPTFQRNVGKPLPDFTASMLEDSKHSSLCNLILISGVCFNNEASPCLEEP